MITMFRIFADHKLLVEEVHRGGNVEGWVERHMALLMAHPKHMIEVEDLSDPHPETRFLRFGTDPGQMVNPIELNLDKLS